MTTSARFTRLSDGGLMIQLSGEFDLATMATLQAYLRAAISLTPDLVLGMSEVEFFDCAALSVLAWARNEVTPIGGSVTLVAPSPIVRRLIDAAGMREALQVRGELATSA